MVYERCEALFVAAEVLRLQDAIDRSRTAAEIEINAWKCQDRNDCPLTADCRKRFPPTARVDAALARRSDNVVYVNPPAGLRGRMTASSIPAGAADFGPTLTDTEGNGIIRQPLDLNHLRQSPDPFGALLVYWDSLARETVPRFADFNPFQLREMRLLGQINVINVAPDDPADFTIEMHGAGRTFDGGVNYTGMRVSEYAIPIVAQSLMVDYNTTKVTGRPLWHQVVVELPRTRMAYRRLLLPFSSDGRRANRLMAGFRRQPVSIDL